MLDTDLSPAAPQGGGDPPHIKPEWCPRAGGSRQTGSPAGHCNHPFSRSSQTLLCHKISKWILPLHDVCFSSLILCTKPFVDGAMYDGGRLRVELAASSSHSAHRRPWKDGR